MKQINIWAWLTIGLILSLTFVPAIVAQSVEDDDETDEVIPDPTVTAESTESNDVNDLIHVADHDSVLLDDTVVQSAPGVETAFVFPDNPDKIIPAGQLTPLIISISNGGSLPLVVLGIRAAIVYPLDFRAVVQNLTVFEYNSTVPVGVQASFAYEFTPFKQLLPRDFGLTALIVYEVDSVVYTSAPFNGTVEITEPVGAVSGEFLFLVLLGLGILGLVGFWVHGQAQKFLKKSKKAKKKSDAAAGSTDEAEENDWLEGTALAQKVPKKVSQTLRPRKR